MTFNEYYELCDDLEKEVADIHEKKESIGYFTCTDIELLKHLLCSIEAIKEILKYKEYEKGGY